MRKILSIGSRSLLLVTILLLAGSVSAETPDGTTPVRGGAAGSEAATEASATITPNLPENADELEAIKSGQMVDEAASAQVRDAAAPLTAPQVRARMEAIEQAIAQQTATVNSLQARLSAATDNAAALAIQQEIQATKFQGQVQVMRIQAEHARLAGHGEQAEQIEAAIARMTGPAPVGTPVDRPVPVPGQHSSGR